MASHPFFILILFLFTPEFVLNAQVFNASEKSIYDNILLLKLNNAKQDLKKLPQTPTTILLENYIDALQSIITEDEFVFNKLISSQKKRVSIVEKLKNEQLKILILSEIHLQNGIAKLKFGQEISGFKDLNYAYNHIEKGVKKFPKFIPFYKSLGFFHVLIGSVPENYAWVLKTIGYKGNIELGFEELKKCHNYTNDFALEAQYIYLILEAYLLNRHSSSIKKLELIHNSDNLLTNFLLSSILTNGLQSDKALNTLLGKPTSNEYVTIEFYDYKIASIYMQKGDYQKAINYFNKFVQQYKGKSYLKSAYYKLYLCHFFLNDVEKMKLNLEKINSHGNVIVDEDKYAQKFYTQQKIINKELMQSRLAFDGGYYEQSLHYIKPFSINYFKNSEDKVEFLYRKARIYHQLKQLDKAIDYYKKTVDLSTQLNVQNLYFAPNSELHLGYLYLETNQLDLAKNHFQNVQNFKNYPYQNSIQLKAKTALRTIEHN